MSLVQFEVKTSASPLLVVSTAHSDADNHGVVQLNPTGDETFSGQLDLPDDTWLLLSWTFVGKRGAKYSIQLDPRARIELSRGSNPVESSISTLRNEGAGAVWFGVKSS